MSALTKNDHTRYVFAGNRAGVLEAMLEQGLNVVEIFSVQGSWLERWCGARGLVHTPLPADRHEFARRLMAGHWQRLISNGCPHILPAELVERSDRSCINIHPSALPDLKGRDPVNGALLLRRDAGASCHLMSAHVDAGPLIALQRIVVDDVLDARLLWQMVLMAEREVFEQALAREFAPLVPQPEAPPTDSLCSYRIEAAHRQWQWTEPLEAALARVRAFNTASRLVCLRWRGGELRIRAASLLMHPFFGARRSRWQQSEVVMAGEEFLVLYHQGCFLRLDLAAGQVMPPVGTLLEAQ